MAILKLKNAGEEMTLAVASVEIVPSTDPKMGAQVKFVDVNGDALFVGESAVERQLDRCGVATIPELAGHNIHFSRAANKNPKFPPYWNIDKARDGDVVHTNGKPQESVTSRLARESNYQDGPLPGEEAEYADHLAKQGGAFDFDAIVSRYGECLLAVRQEIAPTLDKAGFKMTTSDLLASTATLFIERNKRNV